MKLEQEIRNGRVWKGFKFEGGSPLVQDSCSVCKKLIIGEYFYSLTLEKHFCGNGCLVQAHK